MTSQRSFVRLDCPHTVDMVVFSIGGLQAQEVTLRHPELVRKLMLLGTGLKGGDPTIHPKTIEVASVPIPSAEDVLFLFFGRSDAARKAGREFWKRRHLRADQDPPSRSRSQEHSKRHTQPTCSHCRATSPMPF